VSAPGVPPATYRMNGAVRRRIAVEMHVTRQLLLGRINARGPKLTSNRVLTPIRSLTLEVSRIGRDGQTCSSYHMTEITGKFAPDLAITLEGPVMRVLLE
jgi:hypothetical protein